MRTKLRSKVTLLFMTCALLIAVPAVAALADQIQDDVVSDPPAKTINVGGSTTVNYYIQANGSDGCNVDDTHPGTVTINTPAGVTATPSSLSFTKCKVGSNENSQPVVFSSNTASGPSGYAINVSASGGKAPNDGWSVGNASFTLYVNSTTPSDTTAPTLHLPADILQEATDANGAVVTFTATADDTNPLHPEVICNPASGSNFGFGTTQVSCAATDAANNTANGSFNVTVRDTTPPQLTVPSSPVIAEATSASGAVVNFASDVSATDTVDGALTPQCTPNSGTVFSLGNTTVTCTATDAHGNSAFATFIVTVRDTTGPALDLPDDITEEATGPNGATVNYTATATDLVDGSRSVTCTPASGATFPLGETTVSCSSSDTRSNESSGNFKVTVVDTTAPVIAAHLDENATATSTNGAVVSYTSPSTSDAVDGPGTANCTPASGSQFAVGSTTVTCTAKDAAGNNAQNTTFKVNVAYGWSNFLQPINIPSPTVKQSIFKIGSTVPVKFQLTGASSGITDGTFYLKYAYTGTGDNNGDVEAVATTTGTTGTQFRYSEGQYIFNWSTKGVVTKPGNYEIKIYTDANYTNLLGSVSIELKK